MANVIKINTDSYSGGTIKKSSEAVVTPIFNPGTAASGAVGSALGASTSALSASSAAIGAQNSAQTDPESTAEILQQLFSGSALTSKEIHAFRDARHKEFLEHNPFAVRLRSFASGETVAFRVSPDINETRNIAYKSLDPLHMPGSIPVFQNAAPRTWGLSGIKLASRNGVEADENLSIINQLRAWQLPFFGESKTSGRDNFSVELFGAPPEVLEFTAYSSTTDNTITNIRRIPVVVTTLAIPYSSNVDYIKTQQTNQPFPSLLNIDLQLLEVHSPREYSSFNLLDYKHGKLEGF